jgi:hypothetical protein
MWPDIFNDDAFSLISLSAVINNLDYVPGRVGELVFNGTADPQATDVVTLESIAGAISLVPTSARGGPAPLETQDKGGLRAVSIPHIKLEDNINAASVRNVRELGSTDTLRSVRSVVDKQIAKMNTRFDMTLEHHRLGAIKGIILDSDSSVLLNLFTLFGISAPADVNFNDVFVATPDADQLATVRTKVQRITRQIKRTIKTQWPSSAKIWALCGDNFFDALIESSSVKGVYEGYAAAERRLGANYSHGIYEFAGVFWENYQGSDDNSTVAIATDECQFFVTGVPGLYAEYYAPADFMETVNTVALPRYAKVAPDGQFNRSIALHVQTNPLPLCLRPQTLIKGVFEPATGSGFED